MKQETEQISQEEIEIKEDTSSKILDLDIGGQYDIKRTAVFKVLNYELRSLDKGQILNIKGLINDKEVSLSKCRYKSPVTKKIGDFGLWISLKEGKLDYNSGVAIMLRKYDLTSLKQLINLELAVVRDDKGFWVISAV